MAVDAIGRSQKNDRNYKTIRQCVRMLVECAGMGGNLLLDVGPMSDGTIPPEQVAVLKGGGRWMKKHGEAIYGTEAALPPGLFYGASTLTKTRDVLYLFSFDRPIESVAVKGLLSKVRRTSILGGPEVKHRVLGGFPPANLPGVLWIDAPEGASDADATVFKVELEEPIRLFTGAGDPFALNVPSRD
ncbi:MAG: alpha-L-fucosidase [Terrimicrobiaceae bacterium]|nr:alpha-L-fucosidase [Terrimicrobiaceae bacterium]